MSTSGTSNYPKLPPESPGTTPVKQPHPMDSLPSTRPPTYPTAYQNQPVVWTEQSQNGTCPHCEAPVVTEVTPKAGLIAWLACLALFFTGFCLLIPFFICWLPFCIKPFKDTVHKCPNCKRELGKRGALGIRL